ncbi:MAG: SpoIID/LytB domain-containing protein [Planctomycetota bacterium]
MLTPARLGGALATLLVAITGLSLLGAGTTTAQPASRTVSHEPVVRILTTDSARRIEIGDVIDASDKSSTGDRVIIRPPDGSDAFTLPTPFTIQATDNFFVIRRGDETMRFRPRSLPDSTKVTEGLEIAPVAPRGAPERHVVVGGVEQPGDIRVHVVDSGTALDVVALIDMEEYIAGVIAKELYSTWPRAAFQAQAVAARSYALHERERARESQRHYDLVNTTQDQVYGGRTQLRVARRAAETTRGIVLSDRGRLLRAYYSSTCGGRPASAEDTFPVGRAYSYNRARPLQANDREHHCQQSRYYRWSRSRDADELTLRVRTFGRNRSRPDVAALSTISEIRQLAHNDAGRPSKYRVIDIHGKAVDFSAEDLRVASNTAASGLPSPKMDDRVLSGDFLVISSGSTLRFEGRGFGHGVGMCQFGCKALAQQGRAWPDILSVYYPGARLVQAYD